MDVTSLRMDRIALRGPQRHDRVVRPRLFTCLVFLCVALLGMTACDGEGDLTGSANAQLGPKSDRESIVAMARLEPESEVVEVGSAIDDVILELKADEGDFVEIGTPIVVLSSHGLRQAEFESAQIQLERVELEPFSVDAQRARTRAAEAALEYARNEVGSQQDLSKKGFSAGKEFRDAQLEVKRAEEELNEMNAELKRVEGGLVLDRRNAQNQVEQARQRLEQTIVRAPIAGQLLRVPIKPGERVRGRPIAHLGQTEHMYAVAEVHANDIRMVKTGQTAVFSSPALPQPVPGVVDEVGSLIFNNQIGGEDPRAPKGLRVVQVRVRLEDDMSARQLTNLEGQVRINLRSTSGK